MEHLTDADLAAQPAPYGTGRAHEAILAFTRAWLGELGCTQPRYWLLRNLSKHDLSPDGKGMTLPELQPAMSSCLRPEEDLATDSAGGYAGRWRSRTSGRGWKPAAL